METAVDHQTLVNNLIQAAVEWAHSSATNIALALPKAKALKDAVREYVVFMNSGNSKETTVEDTRNRLYKSTQFTRLTNILALLNAMELSSLNRDDISTLSAVRNMQETIIKLRTDFE